MGSHSVLGQFRRGALLGGFGALCGLVRFDCGAKLV